MRDICINSTINPIRQRMRKTANRFGTGYRSSLKIGHKKLQVSFCVINKKIFAKQNYSGDNEFHGKETVQKSFFATDKWQPSFWSFVPPLFQRLPFFVRKKRVEFISK